MDHVSLFLGTMMNQNPILEVTEGFADNMSIQLDHEKRRVLFAQRGLLNKRNAIESYHFIFEAEGFDPSYDSLVDYTGLTEVDIGIRDFREILDEMKHLETRTGRAAMVVGDFIFRHMLATIFCKLSNKLGSSKLHWKTFHKVEDAEAWLDSQ